MTQQPNEKRNSSWVLVGSALVLLLRASIGSWAAFATITTGDEASAKAYYRSISDPLGFSTPDAIFKTTLDDVAAYLGYAGMTGSDFQNIAPTVLMNPSALLTPSASPNPSASPPDLLHSRDSVIKLLGVIPLRQEDILVTQFFAPKIMNILEPEATRKLGWRKLVRLRARPGSAAQAHQIGSGILLFNFTTEPSGTPFVPGDDESFNTQVMLITDAASVPKLNVDGPPTLYWLDYDRISKGGHLSSVLVASFEANEVTPANGGLRSYYVPDGCISCHGNSSHRSMVNYLDTDHWFDRLDNDFADLKKRGLPLLVDARTNDTSAPSYISAFDTIRRFNKEADAQVRMAQPGHDEVLSSQKWLDIHKDSTAHFSPVERATGAVRPWSKADPNEVKVLGLLNQYCFRCHGTVKFSVFDRQSVVDRRGDLLKRISADVPDGNRMPPDRPLPADVRTFIHDFLPKEEKK